MCIENNLTPSIVSRSYRKEALWEYEPDLVATMYSFKSNIISYCTLEPLDHGPGFHTNLIRLTKYFRHRRKVVCWDRCRSTYTLYPIVASGLLGCGKGLAIIMYNCKSNNPCYCTPEIPSHDSWSWVNAVVRKCTPLSDWFDGMLVLGWIQFHP